MIKKEECKEHDAFVLYIYTHGIQDTILCSNNRTLHFHEIIHLFRDENCQYLRNEPKLIFFDYRREGNWINKNKFNNYLKKFLIIFSDEIQLENATFDRTRQGNTQFSHVIVCCSTLRGKHFSLIKTF